MASFKTRSKGSKALCVQYKAQNRYGINKELKLKRHLKKYPNDTVAQAALKTARKDTPVRQNITSGEHHWTKQWKDFAHTLRLVGVKDAGKQTLTKYMRLERSVYDRPVK
jgi:hypothetical protein